MKFFESESVELKSEVVADICKEVIAFANTNGGTIYIGVQDDGTIQGVSQPDRVILQLNNMIRDSIKPDITMFIHYETIRAKDREIIAVTIQKGTDRPYYLGSKGLKPSGVYVRSGTSTDPASETAIRRMIKETDGDSFESLRSLQQDLTFETAKTQFARQNLPLDSSKMQTLGMLSQDGIYTNVALLLSDQCKSVIKAAVFSGTDKSNFQDRREFEGSLFRQIDELYAYLDLQNQTKAVIKGLYRIDIKDYPEEALREALLNAVVHRDYSFSAGTLVSVYEDRIEFVSVGGLPLGISLEDIMLGLSICRNPKLAAIFYRLKLIEAYGTGIPKIINAYEGTGLSPKIEVTGNAFKVTLPNINACKKEETLPAVSQTNESRILDAVSLSGSITRPEVDELLQISQSTSHRILKNMVKQNLLFQEGNGKATRYRKK